MKMKSATHGKRTSAVEVANVSPHGFWLLIDQTEYFLSFEQFPWCRDATIGELTNVELPHPHHLNWPDLDVDLAVDSLANPGQYPLVSAVGRKKPPKRATKSSRR
jgi:hypothetical protein